jgi:tetratricopeptide (TPR) repeat protein
MLVLAQEAIDESLSPDDRVDKAERFHAALGSPAPWWLLTRAPWSETSRRDQAFSHLRLGHIHRVREKTDDAVRAYRESITRFSALAGAYPEKAEYRTALGHAYHWLGETFRPNPIRHALAAEAYDHAIPIQERLVQEQPSSTEHREALARTHYHRGILRAGLPDGQASANADFREAIRLLEPLASGSARAGQGLARAFNGLGGVLAADGQRKGEAQALWEKAIGIDERLVIKDPANREYKLELAALCNNLAALLRERGAIDEALRRSRMAVDLLENVSRPRPSIAIARADAHNLRGLILQSEDAAEAALEYEEALDLFLALQNDRDLHGRAEFHQRLGDLLLNLAAFPKNSRDAARVRELLAQAVGLYAGVAATIVSDGTRAQAKATLENLSRVLPALPDPQRSELAEFSQQLQRRLDGGK